MEVLTLESLAQTAQRIYLDNCIFGLDFNYCNLEAARKYKEDVKPFGFANKLGDALRFSGIGSRYLHRQEEQSARMKDVIVGNRNIVALSCILSEYSKFIGHLDFKLTYLRTKSVKKQGCKSKALANIIDNHKKVYSALAIRLEPEVSHVVGLRTILDRDSKDSRKKRQLFATKFSPSSQISQTDINLVSAAVVYAGIHKRPTAILTCDVDILNLIRSVDNRIVTKHLPRYLDFLASETLPLLYFPGETNWHPDLGLKPMYYSNSAGSEASSSIRVISQSPEQPNVLEL